jgi:hypothetical protein
MNPCILVDNRFQSGTVTASSQESSEFSVLNLANGRPYTFWKASVGGSVVVSCASAQGSVNALGILGHNFGSAVASVFFDYLSGSAWVELVSMHPKTNRAILVTVSDVAASCLRLRIITGSVAPQISYVAAGVRIDMPQPADAPTVPYVKSVVSESQVGKTGYPLGTVIRYKPIEISHRFSLLDRSWVTATFEAFWDSYLSENTPFFYAWDLSLYPTMVFYVWRKDSATFSWPVSMLAYVDSISIDVQGVQEL